MYVYARMHACTHMNMCTLPSASPYVTWPIPDHLLNKNIIAHTQT